MPSDFFIANKSFELVSGFNCLEYISPVIESGSVPISPKGQPKPVGDISLIEVKLPSLGSIVPKSCVEPDVDLAAYNVSNEYAVCETINNVTTNKFIFFLQRKGISFINNIELNFINHIKLLFNIWVVTLRVFFKILSHIQGIVY